MTSSIFRKTLTIKYDITDYPSDTTASLVRTFNDAVLNHSGSFDPSQISVSYNGQQLDTSSDAPTAKYYYSLTGTSSAFTITISANQSYVCAGYTSTPTLSMTISPNDIFYIDYTHTVTS